MAPSWLKSFHLGCRPQGAICIVSQRQSFLWYLWCISSLCVMWSCRASLSFAFCTISYCKLAYCHLPRVFTTVLFARIFVTHSCFRLFLLDIFESSRSFLVGSLSWIIEIPNLTLQNLIIIPPLSGSGVRWRWVLFWGFYWWVGIFCTSAWANCLKHHQADTQAESQKGVLACTEATCPWKLQSSYKRGRDSQYEILLASCLILPIRNLKNKSSNIDLVS